jgi:mono/diheme cytochrome c family protein
MRFRSIRAATAALVLAGLGSPAVGQAPAAPRGETIYAERCKECHESGDERAPQRAVLAAKPTAEIVAALTTGPMVPMAEGLTPEEKQAVAAYLTAH